MSKDDAFQGDVRGLRMIEGYIGSGSESKG